ncbi:MAG: T9SS type A sorting domain-containing protein [Cryomorphaceae bacterium]|nr:T9SS type A sorting domain-containing protein [Cryomorphaceae bacterium]
MNNLSATQSTSVTAPTGCGLSQPNYLDAWYSVTVPADGNITFQFNQGTITDAVAAIYSSSNGTCSGTLNQIICDDDTGPGLMPAFSVTGQTPGSTLWVRLWDFNGDNQGTFSVCAIGNVGSCTPTTADCRGAIPVCSNTSYSNLASGQGCTADLNSGNDGCLAGEHNMTYYAIRIGNSGTWGFEGSFPVTSNGIEYDWALWQLTGNPLTTSSACNLSAPVRCSYASQTGKSEVAMGMNATDPDISENSSPSGNGYTSWINATAGQYYLLGIDRWSTAGGAYTINFTGTATMSCDIMTALPVVLVNFDGQPLERENKIFWTTASQTNNDYFTVEKSKNGISWEVMSTVQGMGTTADVIEYSVLDYDPFALTYYRLKQTDYDGTVKTFDPIVVSRQSQDSEIFSELYPNPSTGDVYFNYTGSNFTEPIEVTLFSTTGGRMTKYGYVSFNNYQGLNIDCKDLSNGVYSVTLRQGSKIEHKKFTIIR